MQIITCVENIPRFIWEVDVFCDNVCSYYENIHILIFHRETILEQWSLLIAKHPSVHFHFYEDVDGISIVSRNIGYTPLHRPYMLKRHWERFPELEKETIFYCDADILFLKKLDFIPFLQDNICYLSDTHTYLDTNYIENKRKDVIHSKIKEYDKLDVTNSLAKISGINREICELNNPNTGGAQYLLKNISSSFWNKVMERSIQIKLYLGSIINKEFFPSEEQGIQSWCADMWAVLHTLWEEGKQTRCPKEFNFAWSTDVINDNVYILHNAGVTSEASIRDTSNRDVEGKPISITAPAFFKGNYNLLPPTKEHLNSIIFHPISSKYFTSVYSQHLLKSLYA